MKRDDYNSEPLDALLRRAATLPSGPATPECADPETLAAYYDRSLAQQDRDRLEAHFADCARCQMQLAAIARTPEAQPSPRPPLGVSWLRPRLRVTIPALAAAAVLLIAIRTMRSPVDHDFRRGEQIAMEKHEAPLMDLAASKQAPASPPAAASAPAAQASNQLAMNQALPATPRAPEHRDELRERAKPLAKARPVPQSEPAPKPEMAEAQSVAPSPPELEMSTRPLAGAASGRVSRPSGALAGSDSSESSASGAEALVTITPLELASRSEDASSSSPRAGPASSAASVGSAIGAPTVAGTRALAMNSLPRGPAWMVGKRGLILMRGADGTTRRQESGVDADLTAGAAPSATLCWVVGRGGTIVRTIDGENWTKIASPTEADLVAVAADSADHAIVTTASARNFETTNGGTTWHPQ